MIIFRPVNIYTKDTRFKVKVEMIFDSAATLECMTQQTQTIASLPITVHLVFVCLGLTLIYLKNCKFSHKEKVLTFSDGENNTA